MASPQLSLAIAPAAACSGASATLTATLRNPGAMKITQAGFGLLLPGGLSFSGAPQLGAGCLHAPVAITPTAQALVLRGAGVWPSQGCTVTVGVSAVAGGNYPLATTKGYALEAAPSAGGATLAWAVGQSPDDLGNGDRVAKLGSNLLLSWQPVGNADSYSVYQDGAPGGSFSALSANASGGTTSGVVVAPPAGSLFYRFAGYKAPCLGPW